MVVKANSELATFIMGNWEIMSEEVIMEELDISYTTVEKNDNWSLVEMAMQVPIDDDFETARVMVIKCQSYITTNDTSF